MATEVTGIVGAAGERFASIVEHARARGMSRVALDRLRGKAPPALVTLSERPQRDRERVEWSPHCRRTRPITTGMGCPRIPRRLGDAIIEVVAEVWRVTPGMIVSPFRERPIMMARRQCVEMANERGYSSPAIGEWLGKDHTSALHAHNAHARVRIAACQGLAVGKQMSAIDVRDYMKRWAVAKRKVADRLGEVL